MFVSMVPDRKQTVSNRRRKDFSSHAPTLGNRCVMRHCHRSSSKSGQIFFVSFCDSLAVCCFLWLSATKDDISPPMPWVFADRSPKLSFHHMNKLTQQWPCLVSQICSHQIYLYFLLLLSTVVLKLLSTLLSLVSSVGCSCHSQNSTQDSNQRSNRGTKHLPRSKQNSNHLAPSTSLMLEVKKT